MKNLFSLLYKLLKVIKAFKGYHDSPTPSAAVVQYTGLKGNNYLTMIWHFLKFQYGFDVPLVVMLTLRRWADVPLLRTNHVVALAAQIDMTNRFVFVIEFVFSNLFQLFCLNS